MSDIDDPLFSTLFSDRILELTILPTEQCNFRCVYCYEDFKPGRMNPEIVDAIKALMKKRAPGLDHLRIGWFGGEPLLAKDIVLEISSYAMSLAQGSTGLFYDSGMSTNGYFLDCDVADQLTSCGVTEFQVSLDGPATYHDKVRLQRNGRRTFHRIWTNLLELRRSSLKFKINLRVHLSKDNIDVIGGLIEDLKKHFCHDERFQFFFKSIVPLGGSNDASLNCFDDQESRRIVHELGLYLGPQAATVPNDADPYVCYAGRPTSLVIRQDGGLAKCTVGLDDPENQVGRLLGNGILKIDQDKIRPWFLGAVSMDREMLRCPRSFLARISHKLRSETA